MGLHYSDMPLSLNTNINTTFHIDMSVNESYKDRPSRSIAIKKAISRAMKGKSNFEGKTHSKKTKDEIKMKRGHDDRVDGRKWSHDRYTGKQNRSYQLPDDHKWGRTKSFSKWVAGER